MIRSKFKFWALLPPLLTIVVTGFLYVIITKIFLSPSATAPVAACFITVLFVFTWIWLVFGELRTKVIVVTITGTSIKVTNFSGAGISRSYDLHELDGFRVSVLPSQYDRYEYVYLLKGNKKVIKLSAFYHRNYFDIKREIAAKIRDLGEEKFSFLRELKEIFI